MKKTRFACLVLIAFGLVFGGADAVDAKRKRQTQTKGQIVHDAEFYVLRAQNGERWAAEDEEVDAKLAALKEKHGRPPNIVYVLWDDQPYGSVGFPGIQKNLGYETPHLNQMAAEGINFTRMCVKRTRVSVLEHRPTSRGGPFVLPLLG